MRSPALHVHLAPSALPRTHGLRPNTSCPPCCAAVHAHAWPHILHPVALTHCRNSYYWFMLAMQIVSLLGLLAMSLVGLLAASGISWLAWLTVLTALWIQGTDTMLAIKDLAEGEGLVRQCA